MICNLKKHQVIGLGSFTSNNIGNATTDIKICYLIVIDLCNHFKTRSISFLDFKKHNFKVNKKPVNKYSEFVPINFVSKELEYFGLNCILNDSDAMKVFPFKDLSKKFSNPQFRFSTCFKYKKSIRADVTNYKEHILSNEPISNVTCFCSHYSDFIDPSVGHVITGNVDIVKNNKLRKLFKKGYTYIEPVYINKFDIFRSVKSDLHRYIKSLATKYSVSTKLFDGWRAIVLDTLKPKIFSSKIFCKRNQTVISTEFEDLNVLKEHFIMTSVDKASNNVSFVCKKYYLDNVLHELSSTRTYQVSTDSEEDIVRRHVQFCQKFKIPVNDLSVPFMHMLPKFHKPTLDFRYIAAGVKSSTKVLSKILSGVFKLLGTTLKYQDNFNFKFLNASGYWIVDNKDRVTSNLNYLNNACSAKSVYSFDFKKLYTNLPHDKLIEKLSSLVKLCFKEKKLDFISINDQFKARWSGVNKTKWSFTCSDLIDMFKFLMDNIYVKFRGVIYRQVIGIPMGCDCASQVADLFLYWYEHNYITLQVNNKNPVVHTLKHASRYIDDLTTPNIDNKTVDIICNDIYPAELKIIVTNSSNLSTTFLDLDINILNNRFYTKLYDKRRDFSFKVVTFPNLRSNVPVKPSYGVFVGELYRICKSSSVVTEFIHDVKLLIDKLITQNFERKILHRYLKLFINSQPACILRHWHNFTVNDFM